MKSELKIAAVFASYNRKDVALECLQRLHAQSRPPDMVVVGDNASADGSPQALRAVGWDAVEVVDIGDNLGNAGAVELAMDRAFDKGADAVWILDDDSWPRPAALEAMLAGPWDPGLVLHPLQEDPRTGRFTWPLQVMGGGGEVTLVEAAAELPPGDRVSSRGVWTGALVPRGVREKVGPVNGDLFIRGEDEEYPWRIEQAGFREAAVPAAVMDHPGPDNLVMWSCAGRRLFIERGLADWKLYYKVRNMVWLKRRQAGAFAAIAMALAYAAAIARIDGIHRLAVWSVAVRDGWRSRLGRWNRHPV